MNTTSNLDRRQFIKSTVVFGGALGVTPALLGAQGDTVFKGGKIRVGHIGCGNVSGSYLPNLTSQPSIDVVSVCDIIVERAKKRAEQFKVSNVYPNIDEMLAGVPFDLLVNTTSMPSHYRSTKRPLRPAARLVGEADGPGSEAGQRAAGIGQAQGCAILGGPYVRHQPAVQIHGRYHGER